MILPPEALFLREREAFGLRMHCEDCALFDEQHATCAHGYPTEAHRRSPSDDTPITFCKDFEVA